MIDRKVQLVGFLKERLKSSFIFAMLRKCSISENLEYSIIIFEICTFCMTPIFAAYYQLLISSTIIRLHEFSQTDQFNQESRDRVLSRGMICSRLLESTVTMSLLSRVPVIWPEIVLVYFRCLDPRN